MYRIEKVQAEILDNVRKLILHKPATTLDKPSSCQIGLTQGHGITEKEFHNISTESIKKSLLKQNICVTSDDGDHNLRMSILNL